MLDGEWESAQSLNGRLGRRIPDHVKTRVMLNPEAIPSSVSVCCWAFIPNYINHSVKPNQAKQWVYTLTPKEICHKTTAINGSSDYQPVAPAQQ